jgi:hypothetical protein
MIGDEKMKPSVRLLSKFRITEDNLEANETINDAYDNYIQKRIEHRRARQALNEASAMLCELLDVPLRSAGLVPEGRAWTLNMDEDNGLNINVWSEAPQRGKRKAELPVHALSFE